MREINRKIVWWIIETADKKILLWRKYPDSGWVYVDCRHLPGGGVNEETGESMEDALKREVIEEVGIDISNYEIIKLPHKGYGKAEKILKDTGEKVLCNMEFNRFKVLLDKNANDILLVLGDEFVEAIFFTREELKKIKQIPWWKEFFEQMGYI